MKRPIPFGKYYLLERVNVGGMAEVFKAKAFGVEGFERLVAVKRILPNIAEDEEFITMFIDEAKIAVQLNHANIAQIFDLGKVEDSFFIALEFIYGKDLRALFDRCRNLGTGPMPVAQASFVIMKVCEGLDYAHNKRDSTGAELSLVHRDVSPQNVLVSYDGEVKLIDFGIAKATNKVSKTQAGILKGKFGYMSPEQVRGLPLDRRSDIFSVGIILYELITGERLFLGESDFSTLEKVRNVEILPPSTYNRQIPEELERIVLKILAKDVEDRYQNAIDVHDELQAFLYSAGDFYSRKDLAAFMRKSFTKEIEEEARKNEEYRNVRPPPRDLGSSEVQPASVSGITPGAWQAEDAETSIYSEEMGVTPGPPPEFDVTPLDPSYAAEIAGITGRPSRRGPVALVFLLLAVFSGVLGYWWRYERTGTIRILAEPSDVKVFVDDEIRGDKTPLKVSVRPGDHRLRVEKAGYQSSTQLVKVQAGEDRTIPFRPRLLQGEGFLLYTVPDGATIKLDGVQLAQLTPVKVTQVSVGKHSIEVSREGFRTATQEIEVNLSKEVRVDLKLVPSRLTAKVRSRPAGARVYLRYDKKEDYMGTTPLIVRDLDASKRYELKLTKNACSDFRKAVKFDGEPEQTINAELACEVARSKSDASPPRRKINKVGYLKIHSKPWANIIVDGKITGLTTPRRSIPLPPGVHRITLVNPDFGLKKTIKIEIKSSKTVTVIEDLRNP